MRTSGGGRNEGYKRLWDMGEKHSLSGIYEWLVSRQVGDRGSVSYSLASRVGFRLPSTLYDPLVVKWTECK